MRVAGLLLDLDGTLYVGDRPIDGARQAVDRLRSSKFTIRYVTNTDKETATVRMRAPAAPWVSSRGGGDLHAGSPRQSA